MYSSTGGKCRLLVAWFGSGEENKHSSPLEERVLLARIATQLPAVSKTDELLSSCGILTLGSPRSTTHLCSVLCCLLCQRRLDIFTVKSIPEHLGICWRDTGELRAAPDVCDARSVAFPCSGSKQGQVILTTCMCYGNFWTDDPDPLSLLMGRCERLTCALLVGHLLQKCHKALSSSKLIWRAKSHNPICIIWPFVPRCREAHTHPQRLPASLTRASAS